MRARSEVEKVIGSADREQIVFTEIPYQINKARLHAKIGELMRDKRIEGIKEARDESDRDGMRLVLELKKDVFPQVVLNQLFRLTDLQCTFGIINLSIVDGRPAVLDLKQTLEVFIGHRREVVSRRTRFELTEAEGRKEIVEGLGMATTEVDLEREFELRSQTFDSDELCLVLHRRYLVEGICRNRSTGSRLGVEESLCNQENDLVDTCPWDDMLGGRAEVLGGRLSQRQIRGPWVLVEASCHRGHDVGSPVGRER
jgi:hypothetical protein